MWWRRSAVHLKNFKMKPTASRAALAVAATAATTVVGLTYAETKPSLVSVPQLQPGQELENISTKVMESNVFDFDSHFIHSTKKLNDRYEQFDVYRVKDEPITYAHVRFGSKLSGHAGLVHGGCIATIIDELCGWTFGMDYGAGFTANLNVNYRIPIPVNTTVLVHCQVIEEVRRKVYIKCTIQDIQDGKIYSDGVALFVKPKHTST